MEALAALKAKVELAAVKGGRHNNSRGQAEEQRQAAGVEHHQSRGL